MAGATQTTSTDFFLGLLSSLRVAPDAKVDLSYNGLIINDKGSERIVAFRRARYLSLRGNTIMANAASVATMLDEFQTLEELDLGETQLSAVPGIRMGTFYRPKTESPTIKSAKICLPTPAK